MDRSFIGHHDKDWYDILYDIGKQNKKGDSVIVCKTLEIKFKKKINNYSKLPGIWYGQEIACPAILSGYLQENSVRAIGGKTKVCETLFLKP